MIAEKEALCSQRIDRWLWHARLFKTRTLAAKFIQQKHVRVTRGGDSMRAEKPSFLVRPHDTLVYTRGAHLRIITIVDIADQRGPAAHAQLLYTDESPPVVKRQKVETPFAREKGAGRPTKKQRRALDLLKTDSV